LAEGAMGRSDRTGSFRRTGWRWAGLSDISDFSLTLFGFNPKFDFSNQSCNGSAKE
jgi:hypothetical protein